VPDGTYKFKILGSTDGAAIDNISGNTLIPAELADDRLTDDIPSSVAGTRRAPEGDFKENTFVAPNPIAGPTGTFKIFNPFQGRVLLRLYTMSGQLILTHDFGEQPPSISAGLVPYVWNKTNSGGRQVARGLYYAVVRVATP
jgi:hypothetical protein